MTVTVTILQRKDVVVVMKNGLRWFTAGNGGIAKRRLHEMITESQTRIAEMEKELAKEKELKAAMLQAWREVEQP